MDRVTYVASALDTSVLDTFFNIEACACLNGLAGFYHEGRLQSGVLGLSFAPRFFFLQRYGLVWLTRQLRNLRTTDKRT